MSARSTLPRRRKRRSCWIRSLARRSSATMSATVARSSSRSGWNSDEQLRGGLGVGEARGERLGDLVDERGGEHAHRADARGMRRLRLRLVLAPLRVVAREHHREDFAHQAHARDQLRRPVAVDLRGGERQRADHGVALDERHDQRRARTDRGQARAVAWRPRAAGRLPRRSARPRPPASARRSTATSRSSPRPDPAARRRPSHRWVLVKRSRRAGALPERRALGAEHAARDRAARARSCGRDRRAARSTGPRGTATPLARTPPPRRARARRADARARPRTRPRSRRSARSGRRARRARRAGNRTQARRPRGRRRAWASTGATGCRSR